METALIFLAVLVVVLLVHELGHFAVAKLARVKVLEFGLGFPPRLLGIKRGETIYSLNLLPIGAFVKMVGEEDPSHPRSLASRPAWVRLAVLVAGPGMNMLLPLVLFTVFFMVPRSIPVTDVVVTGVASGSPAAAARLQEGDGVLEVDGRTIDNSGDLRTAVQLRLGARSEWVVRRGGALVATSVVPRVAPPEGQGSVGITMADARVRVTGVSPGSTAAAVGLRSGDLLLGVGRLLVLDSGLVSKAVAAARETDPGGVVTIAVLRAGAITELTVPPDVDTIDGVTESVRPEERRSKPLWRALGSSLGQMREVLVIGKNEFSRWIAGATSIPVAGPIGIAQLTGEVARSGFPALIFWTGLLSLSLGIINMMPIPALDGGRIAFVLIELARGGRRMAPQKEGLIHLIGFILLMGMLVVVSFNDIQRILGE